MAKLNRNIVGTITELKCLTYFLELGYTVSVSQNVCRYDFILDIGNKLFKIQVKTSMVLDYSLKFSTCSSHYIKGKHTHTNYTKDNIDFFCTWYKNKVYLVPVKECGKSQKILREKRTENHQNKNISYLENYLAKNILKNLGL